MVVNCQHLVLLILATVFAFLVYVLVQSALEELLSRTVNVPGGVVFYKRAFLLMLLFGAVGQAVGVNFETKPDLHLMEYVWAVADGLGGVLEFTFLTLGIYLVLITILLAAMKPKNDK